MPKISLTDLVDIVSKAAGPKATKVAQVKNRADYQPGTDFYKHAQETHSDSVSENEIV